jgi:hypothetical protein
VIADRFKAARALSSRLSSFQLALCCGGLGRRKFFFDAQLQFSAGRPVEEAPARWTAILMHAHDFHSSS